MSCANEVQFFFSEYQKRLLTLARQNLNPVLSRRISAEDIVQETMIAAYERPDYFENNPEIPLYFKIRRLLLQTITDLERKHLQSQKRDAYKELYIGDEADNSIAQVNWNMFAASLTSPSIKLSKMERQKLLRHILNSLPENDRQIIEMRHFDDMSNSECAEVLQVTAKTASIRYIRALQRLKNLLTELSEFNNE